MKYVEELIFGDVFDYNNNIFVLTTDFKSNGQRLCVSLKDGLGQWLNGDTIVSKTELYKLDESNNIIPIKLTEKTHNAI